VRGAFACALAVAAVAHAGQSEARGAFRATLERGACLGTCPSYRVVLESDGRVLFTGHTPGRGAQNTCLGERRWRVSPGAIARLRQVVRDNGFFALKPSYIAPITDAPPFRVSITMDGRTKTVRDYVGPMVGMPAQMRVVEDAIDTAAGTARCIGPNAGGGR